MMTKEFAFCLAITFACAPSNAISADFADFKGGWIEADRSCESYFEHTYDVVLRITDKKITYWETSCAIRRTKVNGNDLDLVLICSSEGSDYEGRELLRLVDANTIFRPDVDVHYKRCE